MADAYFNDTVARDRDLEMRNYMAAARFAGKMNYSNQSFDWMEFRDCWKSPPFQAGALTSYDSAVPTRESVKEH